MAGLNVSLSFFFATFTLCEAARRASKALLPVGAYEVFAREAVGAVQLGACFLEMRTLVELGPWAGDFGPDLLLTLLFLLFLAHGVTLDGASANPTVSLQEFLMAEESLPGTLLKLAAQGLGMQAACTLTRLCWAWELSDLHLLQSLMAQSCSSALRTSVPHGALVEAACAFCFHLTLLHLRHSPPAYSGPAVALLVTVTAYTAGPFTSAFFNPALAASVTFACSGHTLLEYVQVYWLGPLTGAVTACLTVDTVPVPSKLQPEEQHGEVMEPPLGPRSGDSGPWLQRPRWSPHLLLHLLSDTRLHLTESLRHVQGPRKHTKCIRNPLLPPLPRQHCPLLGTAPCWPLCPHTLGLQGFSETLQFRLLGAFLSSAPVLCVGSVSPEDPQLRVTRRRPSPGHQSSNWRFTLLKAASGNRKTGLCPSINPFIHKFSISMSPGELQGCSQEPRSQGWSWLCCCTRAAFPTFSRGTCSTARRTSTEHPEGSRPRPQGTPRPLQRGPVSGSLGAVVLRGHIPAEWPCSV
ncbi:putative aquaporin-12B isoform X1 [Homo sapiens]|uniref:putative aquaporin-12B isoform X1 n=1 Tax=Homo sapiens TaxID=9606 RepID=UPI0005D0228C|nr:aquaporin-12B isoform X1 [Homo sapiens]|eukprot:XP_011509975.1 aquaporin-12B isoform X4 [Homo sapiens]